MKEAEELHDFPLYSKVDAIASLLIAISAITLMWTTSMLLCNGKERKRKICSTLGSCLHIFSSIILPPTQGDAEKPFIKSFASKWMHSKRPHLFASFWLLEKYGCANVMEFLCLIGAVLHGFYRNFVWRAVTRKDNIITETSGFSFDLSSCFCFFHSSID